MSLDLALLVFERVEGAERAYAHLLETAERRRGSTRSRSSSTTGTTASSSGARSPAATSTSTSAVTSSASGRAREPSPARWSASLFGPPGFAFGLVAGATAGGLSEAERAPHLHDTFLDEIRSEVPQKSSALLLLAAPEHVDAMIAALDGHGGRLVRHHLTPEAALALEDAVAGHPRVTPSRQLDRLSR